MGSQAGLGGFPKIGCNCSNGALACHIMYEGTGDASPAACPTDLAASCRSCNLCQASTGAAGSLCFCTKEGKWVCS